MTPQVQRIIEKLRAQYRALPPHHFTEPYWSNYLDGTVAERLTDLLASGATEPDILRVIAYACQQIVSKPCQLITNKWGHTHCLNDVHTYSHRDGTHIFWTTPGCYLTHNLPRALELATADTASARPGPLEALVRRRYVSPPPNSL